MSCDEIFIALWWHSSLLFPLSCHLSLVLPRWASFSDQSRHAERRWKSQPWRVAAVQESQVFHREHCKWHRDRAPRDVILEFLEQFYNCPHHYFVCSLLWHTLTYFYHFCSITFPNWSTFLVPGVENLWRCICCRGEWFNFAWFFKHGLVKEFCSRRHTNGRLMAALQLITIFLCPLPPQKLNYLYHSLSLFVQIRSSFPVPRCSAFARSFLLWARHLQL